MTNTQVAEVPESKLSMIRKLLDTAASLAEDGNEAAARSYEERAESLLARYGWERAMLPENERKAEQITTLVIVVTGAYAIDRRYLLTQIGWAFRCHNHYLRVKGGFRVTLMGFESDLESVEILFTSLQLQALSAMRKAEMPWYETSRVRFNKSWLLGFANRVHERLEELTATVAQEYKGTGAELVVADRSKQVEAAFKAQNPKLKMRKFGGNRADSGVEEGERAADSANLSQTSLGGHKRALSR
jgi:hypothetical protein